MRKMLVLVVVAACSWWMVSRTAAADQAAVPSGISATEASLEDTDAVRYEVARWGEVGYGNHRAVVQVKEKADAVWAHLAWRRQDLEPEKKGLVVFDPKGQQVLNVVRGKISREAGDVVFQPASGPGDYFIYFMPYGKLAELSPTADTKWLQANGLTEAPLDLANNAGRLPTTTLVRFESKSDFDRRDPMELIATGQEMPHLLAQHPKADYLVFPEDRRFPIRMRADLPYRWIRRGPSSEFSGEAAPNEYFTFQVGVYAARQKLRDIRLEISDLRGPGGAELPAKAVRCINAGGTDYAGKPFTKPIVVGRGTVKALWFVVDIPENVAVGKYEGTVTLRPVVENRELPPALVKLAIDVAGEPVAERGCLDAWRMSRLAWLDSIKGWEDEVVPPLTPVEWRDNTAQILNRSIRFGALGFPEQILVGDRPLLESPLAFAVEDDRGPLTFTAGKRVAGAVNKSLVSNTWEHRSDKLRLQVQATVEFDGCLDYRIKLRAERDFQSKDVSLDIPMRSEIAEYFMGLGQQGGSAPPQVKWKWDIDRVTNKLWTGNAVGGLIVNLKHNQDIWPVAMTFRNWGTPPGWDNHGQGGCDYTHDSKITRIHAYTGPRTWKAGDEEKFHFQLLVTPFKPIDMRQFRYRYVSNDPRHHQDSPWGPKIGANIAHVHHGMDGVNPWINYPLLTINGLKAYRDRLLGDGYLDMDIYYTQREISNHMPEIWALRSLDDEVYSSNESITYDEHGGRVFQGGGGYSWLQEHLVTGYAPAWAMGTEGSVDAAIATQSVGRLNNFYVEGMDLVMKRVGFKGLYLDGIGYDRRTMQRIARVMARNAADYRIKNHHGNTFGYAGWRCNSLLNYGEHLPYITDLYIGEGYDYNANPAYWFVEISGIPFGLTNEMLGRNNNPWRGMVYGMDSRESGTAPWLWKLWDEFGIEPSQMIGYWDFQCPVKTDHKDILATVYRNGRNTLVAVASWNPQPRMFRLSVDWKALGLDPQKAKLYALAITEFQPAALAAPSAEIPVLPGRGYVLLLDEEPHDAPPFLIPNAYAGRKTLLQDAFDRPELGDPWKVMVSEKPAATLKIAEDAIQIESPASCFAFAERPLPTGAEIIQCALFSGTDGGATWGTGCALVWPEQTLRINLRADQHFGVDDGNRQWLLREVAPNTWYSVRYRFETDQLLIETSTDGRLWWTLHSLPRTGFKGDPVPCGWEKWTRTAPPSTSACPVLSDFPE